MSASDGTSEPKVFTREERVKQLIDIDKNVVKLLHSAGLAVKALTNQSSESDAAGIDSRKESFSSATAQYFSLLSSVDVNLRRQIYALEEANIIPSETISKDAPSSQNLAVPGSQQSKDKAAAEAGGLGSLDVGWLNSRNDKVGKEMEAELWAQMHSLLGKVEAKEDSKDDRDVTMS